MDQTSACQIFTVSLGGAAGDGVREAGNNLSQVLANAGFEVFQSFKYPSLIRGGHNYARISFAKEKVWNDHENIDVLVAMNEETIKTHLHCLRDDGVVFAEQFDDADRERLKNNAVQLPFTALAKQFNAPYIARSSVALGAFCYLIDIPLDEMIAVLSRVFKEKGAEANIALAKAGHDEMEKMGFRHYRRLAVEGAEPKTMIDGNTALAQGLKAAGLDLYIAYPMTPSTGILHYLAKMQKDFGIKVLQPENEIAGINMAIGAAYAGKRAAVGTATGGFALMQEAMSLAGMSETPVVVAVSQRSAPATGIPTHSSQADLRFAIHSGHGEFPRLVLAPGDPEEAFLCGANALNLAWKYQVPAIVLLDKHVSENMMTATIDGSSIKAEKGRVAENKEGYRRYAITDDGISPLAFPGTPGIAVKATSYEHDEQGIATEDAVEAEKMQDKRFAKGASLENEVGAHETIKVYGDPAAENAILFWGSGKTVLLEAAKYFEKPARLIQVIWMEPFDADRIIGALSGATNIIDFEYNHNGQLAGLLREQTGIVPSQAILRYDSKPFTPLELAEVVNEYLK